jgi:hypothetical protein
MTEPHRIRLRGPWEAAAVESLDRDKPLPQPVRMAVPCNWCNGGWPGFRGRAVHTRAFGNPRLQHADERVWLVVEPLTGSGEARLNGRVLGAVRSDAAFERDVTEMMDARNRLEIEIACANDSGGVTGEVRLEVRRSIGTGDQDANA